MTGDAGAGKPDDWGPYPRTISELHAFIREHPDRIHVVLPSYDERRKIIDTYNYYQRQPGQPMLPEDYLDPPKKPKPDAVPIVGREQMIDGTYRRRPHNGKVIE